MVHLDILIVENLTCREYEVSRSFSRELMGESFEGLPQRKRLTMMTRVVSGPITIIRDEY
jgi:hypothetical protein